LREPFIIYSMARKLPLVEVSSVCLKDIVGVKHSMVFVGDNSGNGVLSKVVC
jgi:hypothetical protein